MRAYAGALHGCCMTSAWRCPAKSQIAAGPAAACPRTTPPADGVERPGKASTIIFDRASFPRRGAGPLGASRAIEAAASPGPSRPRVALAWAALQGRRSATALRVAQPQALGAFPARQVGAACTAFTQAGEIARLQPYAAITRIGARDGPVVPARTVCRKLGVESRYRIHIAFLLTGTAFASDEAYASPAAMCPFTNFFGLSNTYHRQSRSCLLLYRVSRTANENLERGKQGNRKCRIGTDASADRLITRRRWTE